MPCIVPFPRSGHRSVEDKCSTIFHGVPMRLSRFVIGLTCGAVFLCAQLPQWEPVWQYPLPPEIKTPLWITFGPSERDPSPSSTAYILCGGVDANFNGQQDSGDIQPALTMSWSEAGGIASLGLSLPWGPLSFPVRAASVIGNRGATFYVPRIDRLTRFVLPFGERLEDTLLPVGVQAVFRVGDTLLVSRRTGTDEGEVWILFPDGRIDTVRVRRCPNIQQVLWDARRQQLIVLCEGVFGNANATVHFLSRADTSQEVLVPVGDTGNFLLLEGDTLLVVSNGSHELHVLDPTAHAPYRFPPLSTGTGGYGGPREALLLTLPNGQRTVLVSTYSRDVRWIDLATGSVLQILPLSGLAEGMALRRLGDTLELWITQPFTPAYSPDSSVAIFRLVITSSVAETAAGKELRLLPTVIDEGPALVSWKLPEGAASQVRAEVYSTDGRRWKTWELPLAATGELLAVLPLSRTELAPGWYLLRLSAGARSAAVSFFVR